MLAAATEASIRLDKLLENQMREARWTGFAALVFANGRENAIGRAGVRVFAQQETILDTGRFPIGICARAMTATVVGRFVEAALIQIES